MAEHDVEQVWHDFWVEVLDDACAGLPMGGLTEIPRSYFDQIKRELYDYRVLVKQLPAFFDDITGGQATKPNTNLKVVADLARERERREIEEAVAEALEVAQIEADEDAWQRGYDQGHEDGRDRGFEDGLDEARNRI